MKRWFAMAVMLLLVGVAQTATAETAATRMHDAALKNGNAAYNKGDYKKAISSYITAIQSSPGSPAAYRNLARAFFWDGNYAAAVEYYDYYLRLAPVGEQDKVKAERRLAAERAGERVYTPPEAQRLSLAALDRELESGRAYTSGGGGAWGMFETLLRTGYAEPDLAKVRARLARRLLDEFDANIVPRPNQITPRLDLDAWQLQAERLAAAQNIADDPALLDVLKKRSTLVEAAIAMLTSQWDEAANLFRLARTSNPDLGFISWYEVSSLIGAEKYDEALLALVDLEKQLTDRESARQDYVRILRAVALQRLGRGGDAASLYLEVLRR